MCGLICCIAFVAKQGTTAEFEDDFVQVTVKGKLKTGVMAIGGETTGTLISSGNIHWELDCSKNKDALSQLEKLEGKKVYVTGRLELKRGVEIRQRWIVHVEYLGTEPPQPSEKKSAFLNDDGHLRHALVIRDAQGGFAGFSGQQMTIGESGKWKRQPFLNEDLRAAEASGELSKKQLAQIALLLENYKFAKLPAALGKSVGANPRVISIKFGDQQIALTLPPGGSVRVRDDDVSKLDEQQRFFELVQGIKKVLNN
jgi:hypothetical protein